MIGLLRGCMWWCVSESSCSLGQLQKKWIDTMKDSVKKKGLEDHK